MSHRSRHVPRPPSLPLLLFFCLGLALETKVSTVAAEPRAAGDRDLTAWLDVAYQRKASGDLEGAVQAFEAARRAGASPQRVSLEVGYARLATGDFAAARAAFNAAAEGRNADLAARARRELAQLPRRFWADLYADSFAWSRVSGGPDTTDLVPVVRLRGYLRLSFDPDLDLDAYVYARATRDAASHGVGSGIPEIYADNFALAGAGMLLRVWQRRLGFFAQLGPAVELIDSGRDRFTFDARGGSFLGLESAGCRPAGDGTAFHLSGCQELYSEAVYVSRFDHNVIAMARGRLGAGYLKTGPIAWQGFVEGRAGADLNGDYYNNFADAGIGHRWRLLAPVPLDIAAGVHVGRYLGRENVDPAPASLDYLDLRLQAATYVEF